MRLIVDAKSERSALRVVDRLLGLVEAKITGIEPYHKGGFEVRMTLPVGAADWPTRVLTLLQRAQTIGYGWTLTGDVETDVSLTCESLKLPGLEFAALDLRRPR